MDEYLAQQKAERAKMAKLRALRLAAEAKSASASVTPSRAGRRRDDVWVCNQTNMDR